MNFPPSTKAGIGCFCGSKCAECRELGEKNGWELKNPKKHPFWRFFPCLLAFFFLTINHGELDVLCGARGEFESIRCKMEVQKTFSCLKLFMRLEVFFSFHEVKLKVTPCTKNRHSLHSSHATYVFFVQEKSARQDSIQGGGYIPYEKTMDFQVKLGGYPENSRANSVDTILFPDLTGWYQCHHQFSCKGWD